MRLVFKQKRYWRKSGLKGKGHLMWPWMTFDVILYFMKKFVLSMLAFIEIFINKKLVHKWITRKIKAKIPESMSFLWDIEELTFLLTYAKIFPIFFNNNVRNKTI